MVGQNLILEVGYLLNSFDADASWREDGSGGLAVSGNHRRKNRGLGKWIVHNGNDGGGAWDGPGFLAAAIAFHASMKKSTESQTGNAERDRANRCKAGFCCWLIMSIERVGTQEHATSESAVLHRRRLRQDTKSSPHKVRRSESYPNAARELP